MELYIILLGITVVISLMAFKDENLLNKLLLWPYRMAKKPEEYYRIITSGFVHADTGHLAVNMITFYFFGSYLSDKIDATSFLLIYLLGIVAANIPSVIKDRNNPYKRALGASGGVAAIVFAAIYLAPWNLIYLFFVIPIPNIIFALLYLIYSYKMSKKQSNIGHEAHLWGAIFGFVFMMLYVDPSNGQYFWEKLIQIPYFR